MQKTYRTVTAALVLIITAVAAYNYFTFADERKVRRTLLELREKISAPVAGGLDTALTAAALRPLFAPEVDIYLQNGGEFRRTIGRDELLRVVIGIKQQNPKLALKLDFSRRNIKITESGSATVSALATVENFNEPFEPWRLVFTLEKNDDALWQLAAVSDVPHASAGDDMGLLASPPAYNK